jgi:hypothetical protein
VPDTGWSEILNLPRTIGQGVVDVPRPGTKGPIHTGVVSRAEGDSAKLDPKEVNDKREKRAKCFIGMNGEEFAYLEQ